MSSLLYIILGGLLARADGWGTDSPRWKKCAEFFNVWTCSALFALLTLLYCGDVLTSIASGAAFALFRGPGFKGWEKWGEMFWRGLWTTALGFSIVSFAAHNHSFWCVLAVPMGVAEMVAYSGSRKWLTGHLSDNNIQIVSEISSTMALGAFIALIIGGSAWTM